jgi:hypothetical protein
MPIIVTNTKSSLKTYAEKEINLDQLQQFNNDIATHLTQFKTAMPIATAGSSDIPADLNSINTTTFFKNMTVDIRSDLNSIIIKAPDGDVSSNSQNKSASIDYATDNVSGTGRMQITVEEPAIDEMLLSVVQAQLKYATATNRYSFTITNSTNAISIIKLVQMANSLINVSYG